MRACTRARIRLIILPHAESEHAHAHWVVRAHGESNELITLTVNSDWLLRLYATGNSTGFGVKAERRKKMRQGFILNKDSIS